MIQPPSDYDFKRRFVNALNAETATEITRLGFNPENSSIEELLINARRVEQSKYYIDRDDRNLSHNKSKTSSSKKPSFKPKGVTKKPDSKAKPKEPAKGSTTKPKGKLTCFHCQKPGHMATQCPNKSNTAKAARAAREADEEEETPRDEKSEEESSESSERNEAYESDASINDDNQDSDYKSLSDNDSDPGIADWTAAARIVEDDSEPSDNDEEVIMYNGPPEPAKGPLYDWSEMSGYLSERDLPKISKTKDAQESIRETTSHEMSASVRLATDETDEGPQTFRAVEEKKDPVAFRNRATKVLRTEEGPKRKFKNTGVIEGHIKIDGTIAHVLLDCGSTLDMISANFASAAKLDMFQLKEPVKLQMATAGSKSTINFGARAEIKIGHFSQKRYFDVVNLDRYDVIFGTLFLKENKILLNFKDNGSFKLDGRWYPLGSRESKQNSSKEGEGTASSSRENKRVFSKKAH